MQILAGRWGKMSRIEKNYGKGIKYDEINY
jgi:hypothetical protein